MTTPTTQREADERAQKALAAITERLALAYRICCGTSPKQSVGELLDVTINMPEWEIVRAALTTLAIGTASASIGDSNDFRVTLSTYNCGERTDRQLIAEIDTWAKHQARAAIDQSTRQAAPEAPILSQVTDPDGLEVGREYWLRDKKTGETKVRECLADNGCRYFEGRIWAEDINNQAMVRWDIFGPLPVRVFGIAAPATPAATVDAQADTHQAGAPDLSKVDAVLEYCQRHHAHVNWTRDNLMEARRIIAATTASASSEAPGYGYLLPFKWETDKRDVVSICDADGGCVFELNTHTQRSMNDTEGLAQERKAAEEFADFIVQSINRRAPAQQTERMQPSREVDAKRIAHDFPHLMAFYSKYALGPMLPPSCLCCGQVADEVAVKHAELPGIVICRACRDAALTQQGAAQEPIRQVLQVGFISVWCDVSEAEFDACTSEKRIVYRAAMSAATEAKEQK